MSDTVPEDITLPPPEVRTTIEKTAGYVVRNGPAFEQRIKAAENSKSKFQFLLDNDPYNGYYKHVLTQMKAGGFSKSAEEAEPGVEQKPATEELTQPSALEFYPVEKDMSIAPLDLSIIKLVAQFAAVYGDAFLRDLRKHTKNNIDMSGQMEFLRHDHSLHPIYMYYVECYRRVLHGQKKTEEGLAVFNQREFLDGCFARAEWEQKQKTEQQQQDQKAERERMEYASIDWQDFVVVETVEFTDLDDAAELAQPLNRNELEYRSLVQKKASSLIEEAAPDYEADMPSSIPPRPLKPTRREPVKTVKSELQPHTRPVPKNVTIRGVGESRLKRQRDETHKYDPITHERLIQCPLTNKMIPESKFERHISILLRDPKYKEEKAKYEAKFRHGSNLTADQIYDNIKSLVEDKPAETKRQKVTWNGAKSTISQTKRMANQRRDYKEEERIRRERTEARNRIGPHKR